MLLYFLSCFFIEDWLFNGMLENITKFCFSLYCSLFIFSADFSFPSVHSDLFTN